MPLRGTLCSLRKSCDCGAQGLMELGVVRGIAAAPAHPPEPCATHNDRARALVTVPTT
jgi:hypothetical protein